MEKEEKHLARDYISSPPKNLPFSEELEVMQYLLFSLKMLRSCKIP